MKTLVLKASILLALLLPASAEVPWVEAQAKSIDFPSAGWQWSGAGDFMGCTEDAGPWKPLASNSLAPQDDNDYGPEGLTDNDFTTCWAVSQGVGAWIELVPPGFPMRIQHLSIVNGYTKSRKRWRQNSRVRELLLSVNEKPLARVRLLDTPSSQRIELPERVGLAPGDRLRGTVLSIYPGEVFDDVCISEVQVNAIH